MITGLGTAASAIRAHTAYLDAAANDVANVNTTGYKRQRVSLEEAKPGVAARTNGPTPAQGALIHTGQPLDLAIAGDGWFQLRRPDGQIGLTRAGSFRLDNGGQLVTPGGDALDPAVRLPLGTSVDSVTIARDGTVAANGTPAGRIALVSVPNPGGLMATGAGVYAATAASGAIQPAPGAAVEQGAVEASNADLADATVGMIVGQAGFTANVRSFTTQDETLRSLLDAFRR